MFAVAFRCCRVIGGTACAPSSLSIDFSQLAFSTVRCAGTVSGKGKSVELADFLAEIGVTGRAATQMSGRANLQRYPISTLRANYGGLVATLGSEGALQAIPRCYGLMETSPETASGAHAAFRAILGADDTAEAIAKTPSVLTFPADKIRAAHKAIVDILGEEEAAEAIQQNPNVLRADTDTIEDAYLALVQALGTDGAAQVIYRNPAVLTSPAETIESMYKDC